MRTDTPSHRSALHRRRGPGHSWPTKSGFNLRLCATCGHVGCCESKRGDARAHALAEGHPVIYQMPAPNGFIWSYEESAYVGYAGWHERAD